MTFTVKPKAGLPTGTVITNEATIVFDTETPIPTNQTTNTIDAVAPSSTVSPFPLDTVTEADFTVSWSGQDDASGAGLASFDIFVSVDGGTFAPWLQGTTDTTDTYHGAPGHTYAFYSRAHDNAGNVEAAPAAAEAQITVENPAIPPSAPSMLAISPDNGEFSNDGVTDTGSITLTGSLDEFNLSVNIFDTTTQTDLGAASVDGTSFSASLSLGEGTHVLDVTAKNSANLTADTQFTVVIDLTPPAVSAITGIPAAPRNTAADSVERHLFRAGQPGHLYHRRPEPYRQSRPQPDHERRHDQPGLRLNVPDQRSGGSDRGRGLVYLDRERRGHPGPGRQLGKQLALHLVAHGYHSTRQPRR